MSLKQRGLVITAIALLLFLTFIWSAAYLEISSQSKEAKTLPPPSLVTAKVSSNAVEVNVFLSS